ncbi:hypothetical protein PINS_up005937 [Pythium insidiosum]|nr:hypothetical protein PINS_up005937 [Pythium insidiosum]
MIRCAYPDRALPQSPLLSQARNGARLIYCPAFEFCGEMSQDCLLTNEHNLILFEDSQYFESEVGKTKCTLIVSVRRPNLLERPSSRSEMKQEASKRRLVLP